MLRCCRTRGDDKNVRVEATHAAAYPLEYGTCGGVPRPAAHKKVLSRVAITSTRLRDPAVRRLGHPSKVRFDFMMPGAPAAVAALLDSATPRLSTVCSHGARRRPLRGGARGARRMATISSRAPGLARLAREEAGGAPSLGAAGVNDSREMPVVAGAARVDTPRSRDAPRVGPPARTPEEDARLVDISDRASSPPRRAAPASLRLADLGIPAPVVDRFVARGVKSGLVYPWQRAAIDEGADGSSLVYCAPTSGGKSLVANVLLVRRLVRRMRSGRPARALVVLPLPPR